MERYIILDIDGVMCSNGFSGKIPFPKKDEAHRELFYPAAVEALKKIINAYPDIKIILLSSWTRHYQTSESFNELLIRRALSPACILVDYNPDIRRGCYLTTTLNGIYHPEYSFDAEGIRTVITEKEFSYCILDNSFSEYNYCQKDNLVEVRTAKCLTDADAEQAIEILKIPAKNW